VEKCWGESEWVGRRDGLLLIIIVLELFVCNILVLSIVCGLLELLERGGPE
jgi:hypothetical protein